MKRAGSTSSQPQIQSNVINTPIIAEIHPSGLEDYANEALDEPASASSDQAGSRFSIHAYSKRPETVRRDASVSVADLNEDVEIVVSPFTSFGIGDQCKTTVESLETSQTATLDVQKPENKPDRKKIEALPQLPEQDLREYCMDRDDSPSSQVTNKASERQASSTREVDDVPSSPLSSCVSSNVEAISKSEAQSSGQESGRSKPPISPAHKPVADSRPILMPELEQAHHIDIDTLDTSPSSPTVSASSPTATTPPSDISALDDDNNNNREVKAPTPESPYTSNTATGPSTPSPPPSSLNPHPNPTTTNPIPQPPLITKTHKRHMERKRQHERIAAQHEAERQEDQPRLCSAQDLVAELNYEWAVAEKYVLEVQEEERFTEVKRVDKERRKERKKEVKRERQREGKGRRKGRREVMKVMGLGMGMGKKRVGWVIG